MPESDDWTLALLGSGEFQPWTDVVDRAVLERAREGTVLILPTASAPEGDEVFDRWGNMGLGHYREMGVAAEVVPLKNRRDAERPEIVEKLEGAAMVYVSGGNPAYLSATLDKTPFWEGVVAGLKEGLAYSGCSAGIACLGDVAPDSTANDPIHAAIWRPGLGLFQKLYFGPHWDALNTYMPGLREAIVAAVPDDCRLLAIDERTAVVGDGTKWEVMGSGGAYIFDSGEWSEFRFGERFQTDLRGVGE